MKIFLDADPYDTGSLNKNENIKCDTCSFQMNKYFPQLMAQHQLIDCTSDVYQKFVDSIEMVTVKETNVCHSECINEDCNICNISSVNESSDSQEDMDPELNTNTIQYQCALTLMNKKEYVIQMKTVFKSFVGANSFASLDLIFVHTLSQGIGSNP